MTAVGRVSRGSPVQTAMRNCTRDEGRSFEAGSQVPASNRCKLLSSKAMVVSVAVNVGRISRRVRLREASASEPRRRRPAKTNPASPRLRPRQTHWRRGSLEKQMQPKSPPNHFLWLLDTAAPFKPLSGIAEQRGALLGPAGYAWTSVAAWSGVRLLPLSGSARKGSVPGFHSGARTKRERVVRRADGWPYGNRVD
jgi:hypothetical protein